MKLRCLGSGSSGNCYLLEASDGVLIIEAGIPLMEVKKALRFDLSKVRGCLISHRHNDHAKYVNDFLMAGIRVLALKDVFESHDIRIAAFNKEIEPKHGYIVGGFKVFTLSIAHDVPCLGFIIEHREMGRLLFITDTMMVEYVVPRLNHIMIEANYSDDILDYNIENGITPAGMRDRLLHSHMELNTTRDFLLANDLSEVHEIILIHLSGNNSNPEDFSWFISRETGKLTYVAKKGFEIDIDNEPY